MIQDVKLEQEESNLVEFFEEPQPKNAFDKKFVKANRRVYTLEKGLLRANRRVYNLPEEVKERLINQNWAKQIDFTQTSHGERCSCQKFHCCWILFPWLHQIG